MTNSLEEAVTETNIRTDVPHQRPIPPETREQLDKILEATEEYQEWNFGHFLALFLCLTVGVLVGRYGIPYSSTQVQETAVDGKVRINGKLTALTQQHIDFLEGIENANQALSVGVSEDMAAKYTANLMQLKDEGRADDARKHKRSRISIPVLSSTSN